MVASRDASVRNAEGASVPEDVFLGMIEDLQEDGLSSASIRWAVVVGPDEALSLQLQSLPESTVFLHRKAAFKGRVKKMFGL